MSWMERTQRSAMPCVMACVLAVAACAPIPRVVDIPKDGDQIALGVNQPLQVRWGNIWPDQGVWTLQATSPDAPLRPVGHKIQPPANGAQQLETFDFTPARKGRQELTFIYEHKDGQAPRVDERVRLQVTVG